MVVGRIGSISSPTFPYPYTRLVVIGTPPLIKRAHIACQHTDKDKVKGKDQQITT